MTRKDTAGNLSAWLKRSKECKSKSIHSYCTRFHFLKSNENSIRLPGCKNEQQAFPIRWVKLVVCFCHHPMDGSSRDVYDFYSCILNIPNIR